MNDGPVLPDLPGDAQGIDAWRAFLAQRSPRWKTQHATLTCCCGGEVIRAGERHAGYGGAIVLCADCVAEMEGME